MKFEESLNIKLNFDDSVRELCYNEGVYPTQGTRPVFATIQQLIVSRLGSISETSSLTNQNVDEIILSYKNDKICVECFRRRNQVKSFILPLKLTLQSLRKSKMDELQAVVAVHESGHAVAYIILFGRIPNSIHSVTADSEHQGFVDGEHDDKFITKSQLVKAIAVHLAGITAEEIVFGKENITNGASTDIETATKMAADLVKSSGFGKEKMFIRPENIQTSLSVYDRNGEINEEIKTIVREGYELAKTTLLCEEWLLVQLSNHLSRNSVIYRDEIMLFVEKFGVTKNRATSETMGNNYSYRVTLSERVRGTKQMNK